MLNGYRWAGLIKAAPFLLATFVSIPGLAQLQPLQEWESPLYANNPLVGRIWHGTSEQFVEIQHLVNAIKSASYLLLGEKHDNPDHHLLQLMVLNHVIEQMRVANVAFEMMDSDDQAALDQISQHNLTTLEGLKAYLGWDEEGWNWEFLWPSHTNPCPGQNPPCSCEYNRCNHESGLRRRNIIGESRYPRRDRPTAIICGHR